MSEHRTLLTKALRLNDRIQMEEDSEQKETGMLPDTLSFETGYDHLSAMELDQLKTTVKSQASFFMSGKYPKTITARQPVKIDTGNATPTTAGYRRLNQEEQRIAKE